MQVVNVGKKAGPAKAVESEATYTIHEQLKDVPHAFVYTFNEDVEAGINAYSKANDIGLIAMVPGSRTFFESLFHDSLTQKMVYHIHIPLLVLI